MGEPTAGFLAGRLAKASAVPAEQRSADVRAFIETCQLQAELAAELGLPEVAGLNVLMGLRSRWSAAPALKLVRSHTLHQPRRQSVKAPSLPASVCYQHGIRAHQLWTHWNIAERPGA